MPVVLQVLGSLIGVAGLLMIGFGLPIRYQNLDNTMISAGVTAVVGGLVLIGLGAALRELRKLLRAMERAGMPASVDAQGKPGRSPRVSGPLSIPNAKPARAEPRLDPAISDEPPPEPEQAPAPAGAEQRQRPSIFALVRGSKTEHYEIDETESVPLSPASPPRAPATMPERVEAMEEPAFEPRIEPRAEPSRAGGRPSSPAALASRTAARIDMPRPVPEMPRANERGRNLFDSVWPNEQKREPAFERAPEPPMPERRPDRPLFVPEPELSREAREARDARDASDLAHAAVKEAFEQLSLEPMEEAPARRQEPKLDMRTERHDPKPVTILKSGVIDGMAYTLYTDGSIEAQLPTGLMRFSSIEDLRTYLEHNG